MSSRFEKVIVTAVMAGALTLTGCGGKAKQSPVNSPTATATTEPTPTPTPTDPIVPDTTPPVLVDARTVNSTLVELTFSEAVVPGTVAPADFSLSSNFHAAFPSYATARFSAGQYFTRFDGYKGRVGSNTLWNISSFSGARSVITRFTAKYSFIPAGLPFNINAVAAHPSDPTKLNITLGTALGPTNDGGTGMLRLTYTAPAGGGGIADAAGNAAANITLTTNDRGNVRAEISAPALIAARTLNATQIELSFSEPVISANAAALASFFRLGSNKLKIGYVSSGPSWAPYWVWSFTAYYKSSFFQLGSNLVLSPNGMKGTLTVPTAIPATWDNGTGYLRLTYSGLGNTNALKDAGGAMLPNFNLSTNGGHRGNVVDTL